jgi:O-antigen ligase
LVTLRELAPAMSDANAASEDSSFRQRQEMMASAREMFLDHPLLGVGAGNYQARFDEYAGRLGTTLRSYENFGQARYPHNLYLEILAEMGLAGLAGFLAIIAATLTSLRTAYRSFLAAGAVRSANLTASIALALIAYLATSLFLHGTYIRYLWLLVALAAAARRVALRPTPEPVLV